MSKTYPPNEQSSNGKSHLGLSVWCLVLLALILLLMQVAKAQADSIRLHEQMTVSGDAVTLSQIAELDGDKAKQFGDLVVARFRGEQRELTLRINTLRDQLSEAGANWGLLSLRGYEACRISRQVQAPRDEAPIVSDDQAAAVANVDVPLDVDTQLTLRAQVVRMLADLAGVPRDELRIRFRDRDDDVLNSSTLTQRFEIIPSTSQRIGQIPLVIRQYEDGRVTQRFTVLATVERRMLVVVATGSISRGRPFTADSVELREMYVDRDPQQIIDDVNLVIGQSAESLLREGTIVTTDHIKPPVLVRRGELIEVRCLVNGLLVSMMGHAMEDGGMDQPVRVRVNNRRDILLATVTGRREVTIDLSE